MEYFQRPPRVSNRFVAATFKNAGIFMTSDHSAARAREGLDALLIARSTVGFRVFRRPGGNPPLHSLSASVAVALKRAPIGRRSRV